MTNVTDLLDLDINDGEDTFPDLDASNKGSNNDLLQTPSPISENDVPPATQQSPTAFLTEVLQTTKIAKKIRHSTPPEARVRIDVFVSLRNNGQKVDTTKMPKTCITQFSLNRSPNAFRNTEFYKAIVKDARAQSCPGSTISGIHSGGNTIFAIAGIPLPYVQIRKNGDDLLHPEVVPVRSRDRMATGTTQVC
jgi:hypothetical protein